MDLLATIYRYLRGKWTVYTSLAIGHPPACYSHHRHNEIQVEQEEELEDRLSALPDDILLNILERLCLHSAGRTSILSRRWRRLPFLLSHLDIDVNEFIRQCSGAPTVQTVMALFAEATERLLAPTSERAIKRLRLAFFLCEDDPSYLRSIGQAVAMGVGSGRHNHTEPELVDLTLWTVTRGIRCPEEHAALYGQCFRSFLDTCPNAFRCLTSLTLDGLGLAESDVQNILTTCDRLKDLCLKYCGQLTLLRSGQVLDSVFKIDATSSQLVTLTMVECYVGRVEFICAPRLARLTFDSCWIIDDSLRPPLWFGQVPQLRHMCFASGLMCYQKPFALSECLSNATSLSVVDLNFKDEMVWIRPEDPKLLEPKLRNLKELRLQGKFSDCDLKWTLLYLAAAPSLTSFYVKISRHICEMNKGFPIAEKANVVQEAWDFKHYNLNVFEIEGFQEEERLIGFTRLVLERAINLKRLRLRGKEECKFCDFVRGLTPTPTRSSWNEGIKNLVREQITHGLPSLSIELSME